MVKSNVKRNSVKRNSRKTKSQLLEETKQDILEYRRIQIDINKLNLQKREKQEVIENKFNELGIDSLDVQLPDNSEKKVRAQRYIRQTIVYDYKKLLPVLKEKGLVKRVVKKMIDPVELEKVYNEGLIPFEEIQQAATRKSTTVFTVSEVKVRR